MDTKNLTGYEIQGRILLIFHRAKKPMTLDELQNKICEELGEDAWRKYNIDEHLKYLMKCGFIMEKADGKLIHVYPILI